MKKKVHCDSHRSQIGAIDKYMLNYKGFDGFNEKFFITVKTFNFIESNYNQSTSQSVAYELSTIQQRYEALISYLNFLLRNASSKDNFQLLSIYNEGKEKEETIKKIERLKGIPGIKEKLEWIIEDLNRLSSRIADNKSKKKISKKNSKKLEIGKLISNNDIDLLLKCMSNLSVWFIGNNILEKVGSIWEYKNLKFFSQKIFNFWNISHFLTFLMNEGGQRYKNCSKIIQIIFYMLKKILLYFI